MTTARIAQSQKAFLAEILTAFAHEISAQRTGAHHNTFAQRFLTALKETRRQEAEQIIYRYRHSVDGYQCD